MRAYSPATAPQNPEGIPAYLQAELIRIAQVITNISRVPLYFEEPHNPQEGDLASADGTGWDPGSGAGFYIYRSDAWTFIV